METVGPPYTLSNGDHLSTPPYSHGGSATTTTTMGPALNPTVGGPAPPSSHPGTGNLGGCGGGHGGVHGGHGPGPVSGSGPGHVCAGCGRLIQDRFLLHALDRYWHTGCLKCSCCQAQLGEIGKSCFTKAGMILCRSDYVRLFGADGSCMGCGQKIPASELVFRVQTSTNTNSNTATTTTSTTMPPTAAMPSHPNPSSCSAVYHIKCFVCVSCRQPLQPGDRYGLVNGSLVCEMDYPKLAAATAAGGGVGAGGGGAMMKGGGGGGAGGHHGHGHGHGHGHVPLPARASLNKVC